MRLSLISIIFLFGNLVYANNLQVLMSPEEPTVINSDITFESESGEATIFGPWALVVYELRNMSNSDHLTISKLEFKGRVVNSDSYTYSYSLDTFDLGGVIEIQPNSSFELDSIFLQRLPKSESGLEVDVTISGWVGLANSPKTRISKTLTFTTK